jgi:hypothetical protein
MRSIFFDFARRAAIVALAFTASWRASSRRASWIDVTLDVSEGGPFPSRAWANAIAEEKRTSRSRSSDWERAERVESPIRAAFFGSSGGTGSRSNFAATTIPLSPG